jgi:hypothetical protein
VFSHTIEPIMERFMQGESCVIFAYGMTNSGKVSHTNHKSKSQTHFIFKHSSSFINVTHTLLFMLYIYIYIYRRTQSRAQPKIQASCPALSMLYLSASDLIQTQGSGSSQLQC